MSRRTVGATINRDGNSHRRVRLLALSLLMATLSLSYQMGPWQSKAQGRGGQPSVYLIQAVTPPAEDGARGEDEPVNPAPPRPWRATPTPDRAAGTAYRPTASAADIDTAVPGKAPASSGHPAPTPSATPVPPPRDGGREEQDAPAAAALPKAEATPTPSQPAPAPVQPATPPADVKQEAAPEAPVSPSLPAPSPTAPPVAAPAPQPTAQAMAPTPLLLPLEGEMLVAANGERAKAGLGALVSDAGLVEVARTRSRDMGQRNYFSHYEPGGRLAFVDLLEAQRIAYARAGENLARNNVADVASVNTAMEGFMNSGSHRANMLNPGYQKIGVGVFITADGMKYLTVIFLAA